MKTKRKTSKKSINIFWVLAIALVVLIVAMIGFTQAEKISIHNKVNSYIEHEYGTKGNEKLKHMIGTYQYTGEVYEVWENDNYSYNVASGFIYDNAKNIANNETLTDKVTALLDGRGDGYEASGIMMSTYTDSNDVAIDYNELIIYYVTNTDKTITTTDDAAALIWEIVEEVNTIAPITGLQINLFDMENEYTCAINAFEDGTALTLEDIQENTLLTTEKSYLYQSWYGSVTAEPETETEGEAAPEAETEGEENTEAE